MRAGLGFSGVAEFLVGSLRVHGQEVQVRAVQGAQAFAEGGELAGGIGGRRAGGELENGAAVRRERERDLRMRQRGQREVVVDVRPLRLLAAEELPPRRQVVEELPHLDARAAGRAGGADFQNFAAVNNDLRGLGRIAVALAGGEREPAHARDAWQRLAAKAHRGDAEQILRALHLARRVAFEAEQRVIAAHAQTVIRHANQAASAGQHIHRDVGGLRVEGVLHQLLHDAGWPLHHLAGGDLIGDLLGQQADAVHRGARSVRAAGGSGQGFCGRETSEPAGPTQSSARSPCGAIFTSLGSNWLRTSTRSLCAAISEMQTSRFSLVLIE